MNDDQVNTEELEENRRRREAAENATDDGMPVLAEEKERDTESIQSVTIKRWIRHTGNARKNWIFTSLRRNSILIRQV
ncbi:hypothetical protein [Paraburkholderia dipogonis]|jgi:hypothetical protein|uniref:hypothetical protein n=1 Tax=Paraburkholderia dipogonis TaxID=1211383 RepID=UPI0038B9A5B9